MKIVKTSPYKGGVKVWSNRYHFNGGTPADTAHWNTLFDNIVNAEKAVHTTFTTITEAFGYGAGSDVPLASKTYTTVGTYAGTGIFVPLEVAAIIRWSTTARTSKNHPVYLFSYMHNVMRDDSSTDNEKLEPDMKTALETFGTAWISGFSDGVNTYVRAGPNGATGTSRLVPDFLTHRDFRD